MLPVHIDWVETFIEQWNINKMIAMQKVDGAQKFHWNRGILNLVKWNVALTSNFCKYGLNNLSKEIVIQIKWISLKFSSVKVLQISIDFFPTGASYY